MIPARRELSLTASTMSLSELTDLILLVFMQDSDLATHQSLTTFDQQLPRSLVCHFQHVHIILKILVEARHVGLDKLREVHPVELADV